MEEKCERKSICYMSLADAFITRLRRGAESRSKKQKTKGISVEVLPVKVDKHDFIYDYLSKLHDELKGTFSKPKAFTKQTIYECERSNICKGNSSGDPTKTRANGCSAYVSFTFEEGATVTACIVRSRLVHYGHNPSNKDEARVNRIDLALKGHIKKHIQKGMKTKDIMNEIVKWNKVHKNTDQGNRRYFPSRQDVQQLALSSLNKPSKTSNYSSFLFKRQKKFETVKKEKLTKLLRSELRDNCVYYQSQTGGSNPRPMILVLRNHNQGEIASIHSQQIVFIEVNYEGQRHCGNVIYVLVLRDNGGNGFPIAYVITSTDDSFAFIQALQKLKVRCLLNPRFFFLEPALQKFTEMIPTVFPGSICLVSWFKIIQDIHKWLQTSPVSAKEHADVRKVLLQFVQELKSCSKEEDLLVAVSEMQQKIEFEAFTSMMQAKYLPFAFMWCDYGRNVMHTESIASFEAERFFLKIKYQFLKGLQTRKSVEDVARLILSTFTEQRNIVDGVLNVSEFLEGNASDQAALLVQQGWSQLVTWQGQWVAYVPCHNILDLTYKVNLITMECDCPSLASVGPCLHICLVTSIVQSRDGLTPQQERHRCASEAFESCDYTIDAQSCATFHNNIVCVTDLESGSCTCMASALGMECIGKFLLTIVLGSEVALSYTVPNEVATLQTKALCIDSPADADVTQMDDKAKCSTIQKNVPKITISVLTDTNGALVLDESPSAISCETLVIQTHTGSDKRICEREGFPPQNVPNIVKNVDMNSSEMSILSSQALIEKLYKWSKSKKFVDSKVLNGHLQNAYNLVTKNEGDDCEVRHTTENHSCKGLANKSLRTTIQSVKRPSNHQDDEPNSSSLVPILPALKVSRSGRTIKIKEEPDFIM